MVNFLSETCSTSKKHKQEDWLLLLWSHDAVCFIAHCLYTATGSSAHTCLAFCGFLMEMSAVSQFGSCILQVVFEDQSHHSAAIRLLISTAASNVFLGRKRSNRQLLRGVIYPKIHCTFELKCRQNGAGGGMQAEMSILFFHQHLNGKNLHICTFFSSHSRSLWLPSDRSGAVLRYSEVGAAGDTKWKSSMDEAV